MLDRTPVFDCAFPAPRAALDPVHGHIKMIGATAFISARSANGQRTKEGRR